MFWDLAAIGTGVVVSIALTTLLWRTKLLHLGRVMRIGHPHGGMYPIEEGEDSWLGPGRLEVDGILKATIPLWMANPPFNWAAAFLIVAAGVAAIILAVATLLKTL